MKRCARDNVFKTINVMLDYKIETRKKVFKAILHSDKLAEVMELFLKCFLVSNDYHHSAFLA